MTKLLVIPVTVKATLIVASAALARGNTLPVVLISTLLTLVQIGARPLAPLRATVISSGHDHAHTRRADPGQTVL